ncbi:outer membrane beta-barrel protein [Vibrio sp. Makdt]|uniref:outer membrane beta-barrel protein n=1 Tax=Vibrio sp. Makdt TaxID=2998828 RepID=UPI0022CD9C5E|nr:outer membrane beta-barrel protein [Vibrio sp. Makdt]MDA0152137.1 outer membrane beta-barrel protein [Vibrio sp. Makdt]
MKLFKGIALALAIVSSNASAAYSVGLRFGMVDQELSVAADKSKETAFSYGVEANELNYVWKNFSLGWSVALDYSDVPHNSLGDVTTIDVLAGPLISYRIAAIAPEYCGCNVRRVHDGISVFVKPQINFWTADFANGGSADSESDLDFAWSAGLKYQDSSNISVAAEYQNISREVTLNRSSNSSVEIDDDRVIITLGYRF